MKPLLKFEEAFQEKHVEACEGRTRSSVVWEGWVESAGEECMVTALIGKLVTWNSGVDAVCMHGQVGGVEVRVSWRLWLRLKTGSGVPLTAQRGRYLLLQGAVARVRRGTAQLWGHILGSGAGHCWPVCVEGCRAPDEAMVCWREVPTAANVNLYGGTGSHVAWHNDNKELCGGRNSNGESHSRLSGRVCVGIIMVTCCSWMVV